MIKNSELRQIVFGNCLKEMENISDNSVDLIYLDPPFSSQRHYFNTHSNPKDSKITLSGYSDFFGGGMVNYTDKIMEPVFNLIYKKLKPTGVFVLHCDKYASHYLKIKLDMIFNRRNFRNEIIWHYRKMANPSKNFSFNYDSLLVYTKSDKWVFNEQFDYNEFRALRNRVEKFININNCVTWGIIKRENIKETQLMKNYIKSVKNKLQRELIDSDIIIDFRGDKTFKLIDNVWSDIPLIKGNSKEYVGFTTQKPKALLKRIIKVYTNEYDIVLDPMCGSGTACVVAKELNRFYIGIEQIKEQCIMTSKRLRLTDDEIFKEVKNGTIAIADVKDKIIVKNYPFTEEDNIKFGNDWNSYQTWAITSINGIPTRTSKGPDGYMYLNGEPIEVKNTDIIRGHITKIESDIKNARKKDGIIIGLNHITSDAIEEIAICKRRNINIVYILKKEIDNGKWKEKLSDAGISFTDKPASLEDYY